jgi:ankyrin repeat protein
MNLRRRNGALLTIGHHPKMPKQYSSFARLITWVGLIAMVALVLLGPEFFPGNSKLYDAIENDDVEQARLLLESGADPNSSSQGLDPSETIRYRQKPLVFALWNNEPEIAQLLVEAGADPNERMPDSIPVLIEAASTGKSEVVRALLVQGADVRATSSRDGETPLRYGTAGLGVPKELMPEIRLMLEEAGAE